MLTLKNYQIHTLKKLHSFLQSCRFSSPVEAFAEHQDAPGYPKKYRPLQGMDETPYVCLRLPTGGGKTLLSSHAVSIASDAYGWEGPILVLWLVPTDIIRKQTLETLRSPTHPNRRILDKDFNGRVQVFDIADFSTVRSQDIEGSVCIFVATFASFRVNSTDGRKVYAHHENLEPHFKRLSNFTPYYELAENSEVKYSFANLLAHFRPLVIIDEAHNHTTKLSVEVLQRIRAAAIIELTATPADNSNVLFKVSASELKAEDMIKLPVRLIEHRSWEKAVTSAIQTRERLNQLARNEAEYIRPIVLFQAENKDRDVTVDVIVQYLVEQEGIPREQIAIATGTQRELDDIDLFDVNCPIRFVITVQALKEGWDCSFAYVFCSIARVQSAKDAEQLLGRVLRMPYARRRTHDDLNRAYAHVSVTTWTEAAGQMRDNLIGMGFEDVEADANLETEQSELDLDVDDQEQFNPFTLSVHTLTEPNLGFLNLVLQSNSTVEAGTHGGYKVTIEVKSKSDLAELESNATSVLANVVDREAFVTELSRKKGIEGRLSPAERGDTLVVPQLSLDFGEDETILADREAFLIDGWSLLEFPLALEGVQISDDEKVFEIDIYGSKVKEKILPDQQVMSLPQATHWTASQLVIWFSNKLREPDISFAQLTEFMRRNVKYLVTHKHMELATIVRLRFVIEKLLRLKISEYRNEACKQGIQRVLFENPEAARTSEDMTMVFQNGKYPAKSFYRGRTVFQKHFYPVIGDMNDEEEQCAKALEMCPNIEVWVRNIERQPDLSFWLPTSQDKFYPDFVARLIDGRILVVEYKGEHLVSGDDSEENRLLGELWSSRSGEKCLFLMATKRDELGRDVYDQVNDIVN